MPNPSIWKIHFLQKRDHIDVQGVVLSETPSLIGQHDRSLATFRKLVNSYLTRPARQLELTAMANGKDQVFHTQQDGSFVVRIEADQIPDIRFFYEGKPVSILQHYPRAFAENRSARYLLISDIDDTILVSRSAHFFSRLWLMLFHAVRRRKVVEETAAAYQMLMQSGQVQFVYVSGSESNLFHLITSFFTHNDLPEAPLFLRPHVRWQELLQREPRASHKLNYICQLIEDFPDKEVLLFGDDSQQDHDIFKEVSAQYPDRVAAAFVRETGLNKKFFSRLEKEEFGNAHTTWYYYNTFAQVRPVIEKLLQ